MSSHADLMHELNRLFCFISTISQLSFFTFADESVSHASYIPYDLTFLCASDPWSDRRLLFYVPGLLALASKRTIVVLYALYAPQLGIPTGRRSGRNCPPVNKSSSPYVVFKLELEFTPFHYRLTVVQFFIMCATPYNYTLRCQASSK